MEIPGKADIREGDLRRKANALADAITVFYKSEGGHRLTFTEHLEAIFRLSSGAADSGRVPGSERISDSYLEGKHGATVLCVECKKEVSAVSREPNTHLVSYIATSIHRRANHHPELFKRWRFPALGVKCW